MKSDAFWQLVTLFLKKENKKCQPLYLSHRVNSRQMGYCNWAYAKKFNAHGMHTIHESNKSMSAGFVVMIEYSAIS